MSLSTSLSEVRTEWKLLSIMVLLLSAACGGGGRDEASTAPANDAAASGRPSGRGPCALLLQGEVDELFGRPVGAGLDENLGEGIELCSWPSGGEPRLLLQVGPAGPDVRAAVELGEGYRVSDLPGMSGPAAVAVTEPEGGEAPSVAVLAVVVEDRMLVVSPIGLGIAEGGPGYGRVKVIVEAAASRLRPENRPSQPTDAAI